MFRPQIAIRDSSVRRNGEAGQYESAIGHFSMIKSYTKPCSICVVKFDLGECPLRSRVVAREGKTRQGDCFAVEGTGTQVYAAHLVTICTFHKNSSRSTCVYIFIEEDQADNIS